VGFAGDGARRLCRGRQPPVGRHLPNVPALRDAERARRSQMFQLQSLLFDFTRQP